MRLADAILMVTRPGRTEKRQLQRALEALEQSKLLGALVNGSTEAVSSAITVLPRTADHQFHRPDQPTQ